MIAFDYHYFDMSFLYHKVENLVTNGSNGSTFEKVAPSGIFQETNDINTSIQLK